MEIIGHQPQWQFLKRTFELEKIPHAYLFCGPEQIGKKTAAIEFVKLLNCRSKDPKPCGNCRFCRDIEKKFHPDFIFIEPENREIQIGQIRDLRSRLTLHPFVSRFKSVIIDRAHLLNQEAQSALLKILEEPRGETIFILVSEFPQMLLPTILSRVEIIKFRPVKNSEIEKYLNSRGVAPKEAGEIILLSFGKPGRAIDFLDNSVKRNRQEEALKEISKLANSDFGFRFRYAKDLSQDINNMNETLDIWLRYFREILFAKIRKSEDNNSPFVQYSFPKLQKIIKLIQNTISLVSTTNVNSRLALEILLLEL